MAFKNTTGTTGPPAGTKPAGDSPSAPPGAPPEGYEWQWQPDPQNPQKGWWVLAAAAVGAIGSYMSAQAANKPRSGSTDQRTEQLPYREDLIRSDIEAILNLQRQLINQGPAQVSVGRRQTPVSYRGQPGTAPDPVMRTDQQLAAARRDLDEWRAGGGHREGGGAADRKPDVHTEQPRGELPDWAQDPASKSLRSRNAAGERLYGGSTAAELMADPGLIRKLGDRGGTRFLSFQGRQGDGGGVETRSALAYLRKRLGRG